MSVFDGITYEPARMWASVERVASFVAATGDDPDRWAHHAPPSFAAVALIAVAGDLLDTALRTFGAVVHTRQRFEWSGPLPIGSEARVSGEVTSVKERSGMTLVDFAATADGWMSSASSFLMTEAAADMEELAEPAATARAESAVPTLLGVPHAGDTVAPLAKSASRLDIAKYAAASGDWNPIHWDHQAAHEAGLGGVVAHGLLAAAWVSQAAARYSERPDPLRSLELRFRQPLRPGTAAMISGTVSGVAPLELSLSLTVGEDALVTATGVVTP